MYVVSQARDIIVNMGITPCLFVKGLGVAVETRGGGVFVLGNYLDEKNALLVLEDFLKHLVAKDRFYYLPKAYKVKG